MSDPNAEKRDLDLTAIRSSGAGRPAGPATHTNQEVVRSGWSHDPVAIPNTRYRAAASWPSPAIATALCARRHGLRGGTVTSVAPPPHSSCPCHHSAAQLTADLAVAVAFRPILPNRLSPTPTPTPTPPNYTQTQTQPSPSPLPPSPPPSPSYQLIKTSSWSPRPAINSVPGCPVRWPITYEPVHPVLLRPDKLARQAYIAAHYASTPAVGHGTSTSGLRYSPKMRHILLSSFCHRLRQTFEAE